MSLLYSILKPIVRLSVEGRARRFLFLYYMVLSRFAAY